MGMNHPRPDGNDCVRGDCGPMPSRGTKTGMGSNCCADGSDMSVDATNSMGSIRSATKSDAIHQVHGGPQTTSEGSHKIT